MSINIQLKSANYIVKEVKTKTSANFWKHIQAGDLIYFETHLQDTYGASEGGQYVSKITVYCDKKNLSHIDGQNGMQWNASKFELEEISEDN